jgi:hypothetical protein
MEMPSTLTTPQQEWQVEGLKVEPSIQANTGFDAKITLHVAGSGHTALFQLTEEHVDTLLDGLQRVVNARRHTIATQGS